MSIVPASLYQPQIGASAFASASANANISSFLPSILPGGCYPQQPPVCLPQQQPPVCFPGIPQYGNSYGSSSYGLPQWNGYFPACAPTTYQSSVAAPIYNQPTFQFTNHVSDMFRPIISTNYDIHRFQSRDIYQPIQYNQQINQYMPNQQITMPGQYYNLPVINQYPQQQPAYGNYNTSAQAYAMPQGGYGY